MTIEEPFYKSKSIGMVKIGIRNDRGQIIANVIGNDVIEINDKVSRAIVTGPDRLGRYAIGSYVYFITKRKNKYIAISVTEANQNVTE
ncbi:hypothetical protein BGL34_04415 [Fructilactobacillus lindneri]|nr:hypothetical protein [Fructilactobacillus lindneri]ANZ57609.1 hypothetical protein AYR60_01885 [Fructilactobacillus lindneri]ANZ58879.1 hypothetical protein AYR59_01885 [Fructilactobacillus lindneri]POG97760.1 hypothetical protein BGL31_06030 [Fructilactobacillus lindneri]POH00014.1 hypothetical protein BGL32_04435 [Fructilactobacillus lindneri]POH02441.1 hypothetical protein BGL33_04205 [Fructilactobacillus lindneri]